MEVMSRLTARLEGLSPLERAFEDLQMPRHMLQQIKEFEQGLQLSCQEVGMTHALPVQTIIKGWTQ